MLMKHERAPPMPVQCKFARSHEMSRLQGASSECDEYVSSL